MSGATEYPAEVQAAVMAALLAGQSVTSIAAEYKIPRGTVSGWKRKAGLMRPREMDAQLRVQIGDALLEYVVEALRTLSAQQIFFRDETWLHQQSASEIGVLHGISADKVIRLLEALAGDEEEEPVLS